MSSEYNPKNPNENLSKGLHSEQELRRALEQIESALRGIRFGSVNVIVQDGVVVQIDRTEKYRLRNAPRPH